MIEENAADSRQLLSEALAGQEKMHSRLKQKLQERKRKRMERVRLGDAVARRIDVTEVGGTRGSLHAMRNRNSLKSATSSLKEARIAVAELNEDLMMKRGNHTAAMALRETRWKDEDAATMKQGMDEIDNIHHSRLRQMQLEKEAEVEHAKEVAATAAHLDMELEEIISRHAKNSEHMRIHMQAEREHHKNMLEERLNRRR